MRYKVKVFDKFYDVYVDEIDENTFEVLVNGKRAVIRLEKS